MLIHSGWRKWSVVVIGFWLAVAELMMVVQDQRTDMVEEHYYEAAL